MEALCPSGSSPATDFAREGSFLSRCKDEDKCMICCPAHVFEFDVASPPLDFESADVDEVVSYYDRPEDRPTEPLEEKKRRRDRWTKEEHL
ncbi:hypothetical protein HPP92_012834 [Vanilla planifolia]|uniref:Uncharacterized protein n=1 Tax=Vanilla planifolia TaxID=51239 RepID=A0A835QQK0_VANPL|nr:hypothetical protein HPP92_012834 [Vanilla planifolia]